MKFNTINDLIRELDIDKNHWINKEALEFAKPKNYKNTSVTLKHIPKWLLAKKFKCTNGHLFSPKWLEKRPPVSIFMGKNGNYLQQTSTDIICPICKVKLSLPLPAATFGGEISIFGDEAFRTSGGSLISVYSFVSFSGNNDSNNRFNREVVKIKKKNNLEIFHLKDMNFEKQGDTISDFIKLIKKFNESEDLNIYSSILISDNDKPQDKEKQKIQTHCFSAAMLSIIQECTVHNLAPKFFFERTERDGWAKNFFKGARLNLSWAVITNSLPVGSPSFVIPETNPLLEVADLISYLIARKIYQVAERKQKRVVKLKFHPDSLGGIRYILSDKNKNFWKVYSKNIPLNIILNGHDWEKEINKRELVNQKNIELNDNFLYLHESQIPQQ